MNGQTKRGKMRVPLITVWLALLESSWVCIDFMAAAYPMIFHLDGAIQKCIDYSIPQDDDANFIVAVLPVAGMKDDLLDEYVNEWSERTKDGGDKMPKEIPMSPKILEGYTTQVKKGFRCRAGVMILFPDGSELPIAKEEMSFYKSYVFHSIVQTAVAKGVVDVPRYDHEPTTGYRICFHNRSKGKHEGVSFIFESVHWDDNDDDFTVRKTMKTSDGVIKKHHLTPIESEFDAALAHASQIADEMHYAEKRSHRIYEWKQKSFYRLRYYGYFSVLVLMGTAGTQVFYLKRYFKKKKLL